MQSQTSEVSQPVLLCRKSEIDCGSETYKNAMSLLKSKRSAISAERLVYRWARIAEHFCAILGEIHTIF
jgi:hypothetical protein